MSGIANPQRDAGSVFGQFPDEHRTNVRRGAKTRSERVQKGLVLTLDSRFCASVIHEKYHNC